MRRMKSRPGFTLVPLLMGVLVVAVIGLGIWNVALQTKLNEVDRKGRELRTWIGTADGPTINATGGLTTWLIDFKKHVNEHIGAPASAVHTGAGDNHADPPPPPVW